MDGSTQEWRPGSFTKNFSWGSKSEGLKVLHETIRIGFEGRVENTTRQEFRERIARTGRPDFIPINFFLLNKIINNQDFIIADELVFNAINFEHNKQFDRLAIFAFLHSYVGQWKSAKNYQSRPALWAKFYIIEQVADLYNWDTKFISADDIENYLKNDSRYKAKTTRKLSTNLNYILELSDFKNFEEKKVTRLWTDCLFLALDRILDEREHTHKKINNEKYLDYLTASYFNSISGKRSLEKDLAIKHIITLYQKCGGRERFSEETIRGLHNLTIPDVEFAIPNNLSPIIAIHPSNHKIMKSLPKVCAILAKYAGFITINIDEYENFDVSDFVSSRILEALINIKEQGLETNITAHELMQILRDQK